MKQKFDIVVNSLIHKIKTNILLTYKYSFIDHLKLLHKMLTGLTAWFGKHRSKTVVVN